MSRFYPFKNQTHILVYFFSSEKMVFLAMHIIRDLLWNRMGDQWISENLITFIVKVVFGITYNDTLIKLQQKCCNVVFIDLHFSKMHTPSANLVNDVKL